MISLTELSELKPLLVEVSIFRRSKNIYLMLKSNTTFSYCTLSYILFYRSIIITLLNELLEDFIFGAYQI